MSSTLNDDDYSTADDATMRTTSTDVTEERDEVGEIRKVIEKETKIVRVWRWVVLIAMLIVSGVVTAATYIFLRNEEDSDFENSFEQLASTMIESSRFTAKTIRSSCKDFAQHMTSYAQDRQLEWPYVTLPDLSIHGQALREQTGAQGFWTIHSVQEGQYMNWTNYVLQNIEWYGNRTLIPFIYSDDGSGTEEGIFTHFPGPWSPTWQIDPPPAWPLVNRDWRNVSISYANQEIVESTKASVMSNFLPNVLFALVYPEVENNNEPYSIYYQPVFDSFLEDSQKVVAQVMVSLRWAEFFENKLPESAKGIQLVLDNECGKIAGACAIPGGGCSTRVTWEIRGRDLEFLGFEDLHSSTYDSYEVNSIFDTHDDIERSRELGACVYSIHLYPTSEFEDEYKSATPIILSIVVGAVFLSIIGAFLLYDNFQRQRNTKVVVNAAKSNALVTSLFPSNIRDRLLEPVEGSEPNASHNILNTNKGQLKSFLDGNDSSTKGNKPIADLFMETTVMFADITGFTSWSSVREPSQILILLETIFFEMDRLAKKRKIFKVETVGDCYVAVAGLPEPMKDHAVAMTRFARETLVKVQDLVKRLEVSLGPDTGDLGVRIGLHSGVVTAGVLRGDRARFQLFGETVNKTALIESTGERNRVHISKETCDLLIAAGKGHWLIPREEPVSVKGKGNLETFWLDTPSGSGQEVKREGSGDDEDDFWADAEVSVSKEDRLIDWQVDVFTRLLKQVVARRGAKARDTSIGQNSTIFEWKPGAGKTCLDEVKEIIMLPEFDAKAASAQENPETIDLGEKVTKQLREFIGAIAGMYRDNDFHNFEHCCHVTMSVTKLLSRIVMPSDLTYTNDESPEEDQSDKGSLKERPSSSKKLKFDIASSLHDHTYGITSDPLTQFALVFSALIHDVDHTGVPNATLVKENSTLAKIYRNQSVAEQNSIDMAMDLLTQGDFGDLQACIYSTEAEFERFRQLVIQTVLATDIVDKELKNLRNARWETAFAETPAPEESPLDTVNRKATIVIEHLIQASDVAHTMQHWHVYLKWNKNFFNECYRAFKEGRAAQDPSENWYKGEIGFFDFYIIPLAKKLKKCGVFGVSSDEYLNYALQNRKEWEERGQEVVASMVESVQEETAGFENEPEDQ